MVEIKAELTEEQAEALAQFFKRIGWEDYRKFSVDNEDAYNMRDGGEKVRDALAKAGFEPR